MSYSHECACPQALFSKIPPRDLERSLNLRASIFGGAFLGKKRTLAPQTYSESAQALPWIEATNQEFGLTKARAVRMRTFVLLYACKIHQLHRRGLVHVDGCGTKVSPSLITAIAQMDLSSTSIKASQILAPINALYRVEGL